MHRISFILFLSLVLTKANAQTVTLDEADKQSYALYEQGKWKELLQFGKEAINAKQDFLFLRLRLGYAAFMCNNFGEAFNQYQAALKFDAQNQTAHYYSWLCLTYLGEPELASLPAGSLDAKTQGDNKLHPLALTGLKWESTYKSTDATDRGNAWYHHIDLGTRLGWRINMLHSLAYYGQNISEPQLKSVNKNNSIDISQTEYYNRTTFNISNRVQAVGAYHFLYTSFNNYTYYNNVGLIGVKYFGGKYELQADAMLGTITDSTVKQFDLKLGVFPLGNLDLYSYSTASVRSGASSAFNFKEVLGFKLLKNTWLELNATFGEFQNYAENDGFLIYNAIDRTKGKAGAFVYFTPSKKLTLQAGYGYEQMLYYNSDHSFHQYSITGGLSCKF